jgi:V-type H+-transporting ATPase subunit H
LLIEQKQWTDPDMMEGTNRSVLLSVLPLVIEKFSVPSNRSCPLFADIDELRKILSANYHELTKWEVYLAELDSGMLKEGIVHTEQFFKSNARKMEGMDGDFCHVKSLIQLISRREDDETVSMALFDLGEFVRHYPNGKSIVNRLGAKQVVMPLLQDHENDEIQRQALLCISKMLVNNWKAVVVSS